jgi:hypothetical protein
VTVPPRPGENCIDLRRTTGFAAAMRVITHLLGLSAVILLAGCASKPAPQYGDVPGASKGTGADSPVVRPSNELAGKVVSFNSIGRFVVLNFPLTRMPAMDQKMFLYRDGLKVGEVKITGPQKDDNIVADLVNGDAKSGDEVRAR